MREVCECVCGVSVCFRAYVCVLSSFFCVGFLVRAVCACMISFFFLSRSRALFTRMCFPFFFGALARTVVCVIPFCVCVFVCVCARTHARDVCACVYVFVIVLLICESLCLHVL